MSSIHFNSTEGRILLGRLVQERIDKLEEIHRSVDDKAAERLRGFVDAIDWVIDLPNEHEKQEILIGDVYDCAE
jgi:hypothetical protein